MRILLCCLLALQLAPYVYAARSCDGDADYLVTSGRAFTSPSARTVHAKLYARTIHPDTFSSRIVSERGTTGWFFYITDTNTLGFFHSGSTNLQRVANNSVISTNTWYWLSVRWTGSATATTVTLYVNGVEVSGYQTTTNGVSLTNADASGTYICTEGDGAFAADLDGLVAEVAIYNIAQNVGDIFSIGSGKASPLQINRGLVRYWPLYGTTSPEPDFAGGNFHATVTGPVRADHPNAISIYEGKLRSIFQKLDLWAGFIQGWRYAFGG